jgi:tetratricopeptide (TPR) repeat protein
MAGRSQTAIDAARTLSTKVNVDVARQVTKLQELLAYYPLTLVTFGRWDDVLAATQPPADMRYATGLVDYARGVAFAATGRSADAAAMLDSVTAIANAMVAVGQAAMTAGADEDRTVMTIAEHSLAGEIARRSGKLDAAIGHFREAVRLEDGFNYTEPPQWYFPVRHPLGETLLAAQRPAEAETVYREDLKRFRENGWALHGLGQALHAQRKHDAAKAVDARLQRAWSSADIPFASMQR